MFKFIKQVPMTLLSFIRSLAHIAKISNHKKCISQFNEPCLPRPTLIDLNSNEPCY